MGEHETPAKLRRLVASYVKRCNNARRLQPLGYETPSEWYHSGLMAAQAAALQDASALSSRQFVSKQVSHFGQRCDKSLTFTFAILKLGGLRLSK